MRHPTEPILKDLSSQLQEKRFLEKGGDRSRKSAGQGGQVPKIEYGERLQRADTAN